MPIENELKFVLRPEPGLEDALLALGRPTHMSQAYLGGGARIRRIEADGTDRHVFTYKKPLPCGASLEIETDISARDFELLSVGAQASLVKTRFSVHDGDVLWDIDVFLDAGGFCMAEAEMPEGMASPPRVLPFLASRVVHRVAQGDDRFSSYSLCKPGHAAALLETLRMDGAW